MNALSIFRGVKNGLFSIFRGVFIYPEFRQDDERTSDEIQIEMKRCSPPGLSVCSEFRQEDLDPDSLIGPVGQFGI